jgi:hypothetical protein
MRFHGNEDNRDYPLSVGERLHGPLLGRPKKGHSDSLPLTPRLSAGVEPGRSSLWYPEVNHRGLEPRFKIENRCVHRFGRPRRVKIFAEVCDLIASGTQERTLDGKCGQWV